LLFFYGYLDENDTNDKLIRELDYNFKIKIRNYKKKDMITLKNEVRDELNEK